MSHVVAFAPFSQNSNTLGSAGLAHAQPTHMRPACLFCFSKTRLPFNGTCSRVRLLTTGFTEPQPPAWLWSARTRRRGPSLRFDGTGHSLGVGQFRN